MSQIPVKLNLDSVADTVPWTKRQLSMQSNNEEIFYLPLLQCTFWHHSEVLLTSASWNKTFSPSDWVLTEHYICCCHSLAWMVKMYLFPICRLVFWLSSHNIHFFVYLASRAGIKCSKFGRSAQDYHALWRDLRAGIARWRVDAFSDEKDCCALSACWYCCLIYQNRKSMG